MRLRFTIALSAALAAVVLTAAVANAHDTWLLPVRIAVPPGLSVVFDLTSGMAFPATESTIKPGRVATARLRLGPRIEPLPAPHATARSLRYDVFLRQAGIATIWTELAPRELELDPDQVTEYLAEVGAPDSVRYRYLAQPIPRRWRERYVKHATTYVRVSSPVRPVPVHDSSWSKPTGMAFELVPERDPTALHPGDLFVVRLLRRGTPVAGATVGLTGPGAAGANALLRQTDDVGRVAFVVPRAGRWLARATELRRSANPSLDWESDFATLTFAVR
jgi:hypothetical protein